MKVNIPFLDLVVVLLRDRLPARRVVPHVPPRLDRPKRNRQPDPVQPRPRDLRDVLLRDERAVVRLERLLEAAAERGAERPLVDGAGVLLEQLRM